MKTVRKEMGLLNSRASENMLDRLMLLLMAQPSGKGWLARVKVRGTGRDRPICSHRH